MIDSRELRIGNLIYEESAVLAGNNMLQKVKSISEDTIGVESDLLGVKLTRPQYCSPIPLTPEILKKAGWIVVDQGSGEYWWNERAIWFHIIKNKEVGNLFANFNGNAVYIKYVHQLQNLYFALTQTEITINMK